MSATAPLEVKIMRTDIDSTEDAEVRVNGVLHTTLHERHSVNIAVVDGDVIEITFKEH